MEERLNDRQLEAVRYTEGPLLILAGAGSGKTKVLVHRIAYLIDECRVSPYNIMAITFTNKAAREMRKRVDRLITEDGSKVWVMTFHASCVRILRRFIDRISYDTNFSIYDTDDQKNVIKRVYKNLNLDPKYIKERVALKAISSYKNELVSASEAINQAADFYERQIAAIYAEYQKLLIQSNALDFDDIIVKAVELLEKDEEVRGYYQDKFRYIMVDEYQDTNNAQFRLIELLAGAYKNLCVVGDDDQSIYKFRGANISNILNFEQIYKTAKVIKLEQNYRSKSNILKAANEVIKNNRYRKQKSLWTDKSEGRKIRILQFENAQDEAESIIREISQKAGSYSDYAILYRTNAQSRLLEERCVLFNVPYQLVGGVNFYQRKEIKDVLSYLKLLNNTSDDLSIQRIINVPKRSIGAISVAKILSYGDKHGENVWSVISSMYKIDELKKLSPKFEAFTKDVDKLIDKSKSSSTVAELIDCILEDIDYKSALMEEGEEDAQARLENIGEFRNKAVDYHISELDRFLEDIALIADIDNLKEGVERVTLMTLHAAKGLEFPYVYISGMEEGLFPSSMSISADTDDELEEERRLCYVGITRAKEELSLSYARFRMYNGDVKFGAASRFIAEIPGELIESNTKLPVKEYIKPAVKETKKPNYYTESYTKPLGIVKKTDKLAYTIGDRVRHSNFGLGKVLDIEDGAKDYKVSVDFDEFGIKKMFAGFAKLEKV